AMDDAWYLRKVHCLAALTPAAGEELRKRSSVRTHARGETIFAPRRTPEFVFFLEAGLVRVFRASSLGEEITFGFVRPGEVFGEVAVLGEKSRESFAEAARLSRVWRIPRDAFLAAMQAHPSLVLEITKQVHGRLRRVESRVVDLVFRDARTRIARILLELGEDFGTESTDWVSLEISVNQSDLATLVGATRQTVNEALGELKAEDLVTLERGRITLLRPDKLREIASGLPDLPMAAE
ncbi:MAG: Crp/Fnr family transcriptional regulator, partial [Myxococcales bacterium]